MSSSLTYVYCLVRASRTPSLHGVPRGMPRGGAVRIVPVPGLSAGASTTRRGSTAHWLVVSSVPQRAYNEAVLQRELQRLEWIGVRALAHEAVVEHFLKAEAVLPMQLFALFSGDDRAVDHVRRDARRISRLLSKIAGQVEWGLRLTLDAAETHTKSREATSSRKARTVASGAEYLAHKRDLRDVSRVRVQRARADANRVYRAVVRDATAARRRSDMERGTPGSRLVLDAAFLVPASRSAAFRAAVRQHLQPLKRSGISADLTGPWPAYNFI